ncbi:hypothetical protein [Sphingomonas sp. SAFR-052]|uniref:hypothetical protein n=1 Tax=Sphingomonas sp. SAFR-052 TaxID=3436867 RepID=UPI003F822EB6
MTLPANIQSIDISQWENVAPDDFRRTDGLLEGRRLEAGEALKYSRLAGRSYDEIAYRFSSCHSHGGPVGLASTLAEREVRTRRDAAPRDLDTVASELTFLAHRPLAVPSGVAGRFRYEIRDRDLIKLIQTGGGSPLPDLIFSLRDPPDMIDRITTFRDEPTNISRVVSDLQLDAVWLPLTDLITFGRFPGFEEWNHAARTTIQDDHHYVFVSHRWSTPDHPDPDGRQCRMLLWQVLTALLEAIDTAATRGLRNPRGFAAALGHPVGVYAGDFAEAIIVNLLRPNCNAEELEAAAAAACRILPDLETVDAAAGVDHESFERLRRAIGEFPELARLADRMRLWIDYSCIPQASEAADNLIAVALERLSAVQVMGSTVIMLDDPFDYLSRAWCTLEAGISDGLIGQSYLMAGTKEISTPQAADRSSFQNLMADRAHLIWRATLDTMVFGVQDGRTSIERLGLSMTKAEDADHVHRQLVELPAPQKVHVDSSELLTGALPVFRRQALSGPASQGTIDIATPIEPPLSLDWSGALQIDEWGGATPASHYRSFGTFAGTAEGPTCHVTILASCEGEAVLMSAWTLERIGILSDALGLSVPSISWLASDIAPVGEFVDGKLVVVEASADALLVIASEARFSYGDTAKWLLRSAVDAGLHLHVLLVDRAVDNLRKLYHGRETPESRGGAHAEPQILAALTGGIFRGQLTMLLDALHLGPEDRQ